MVKLFKNKVDITGVAVLLMAFFVTVGFKAAESMQTTKWYEVTSTGINPEDHLIGEAYIGNPTGDCDVENPEEICAIELTLGSGSNPPENIQEALDREEDSELDVKIQDYMYRFE